MDMLIVKGGAVVCAVLVAAFLIIGHVINSEEEYQAETKAGFEQLREMSRRPANMDRPASEMGR